MSRRGRSAKREASCATRRVPSAPRGRAHSADSERGVAPAHRLPASPPARPGCTATMGPSLPSVCIQPRKPYEGPSAARTAPPPGPGRGRGDTVLNAAGGARCAAPLRRCALRKGQLLDEHCGGAPAATPQSAPRTRGRRRSSSSIAVHGPALRVAYPRVYYRHSAWPRVLVAMQVRLQRVWSGVAVRPRSAQPRGNGAGQLGQVRHWLAREMNGGNGLITARRPGPAAHRTPRVACRVPDLVPRVARCAWGAALAPR